MGRSQELYKKAKKIIPGGTQLLSKRPEMFLPGLWPAYYARAKGCQVWDLDGKRYTDMSNMGVGSCILGYADSDVNASVKSIIDRANMTVLNAPEEVELAQLLLKIHKWAGMVRYARTGGEAMAVAVRIARAYSRKDMVLFCGYHGWHDWYLSANMVSGKALEGHLLPGLNPLGVPAGLKGTAYPFKYNDTEGFLKLVNKHKGRIGAVIMEPVRNFHPHKEFIQTINDVVRKLNIVLLIDEVTAGFRFCNGGAHLLFGLKPDIAVFAKGMSNGFPMAAIIGKKRIMKSAGRTFISSTYWTDRIGPAAALASINKIIKNNVVAHLSSIGMAVQDGWKTGARKHGLDIEVNGVYPISHFFFKHDRPLVLKTLFTQLMLKEGFLAATDLYVSFAHKQSHIKKYIDTLDGVFAFIARAIKTGKPERYLKGEVCHSGFRRLT